MYNRSLTLLLPLILISFAACDDASHSRNSKQAKGDSPVARTPLPVATVDELASGKKAFETNCMICHRSDGTGGKLTVEGKSLNVEDLTSAKFKSMSDEKIIGYIMRGVLDDGMPAFQDKLSEGEMRDVVKYIRTQFHNQ